MPLGAKASPMGLLHQLPAELHLVIFKQLGTVDKICLATASKQIYEFMRDYFGGEGDGLKPGSRQCLADKLELLRRMEDANPDAWLCVECVQWHVASPNNFKAGYRAKKIHNSKVGRRMLMQPKHEPFCTIYASRFHQIALHRLCETMPLMQSGEMATTHGRWACAGPIVIGVNKARAYMEWFYGGRPYNPIIRMSYEEMVSWTLVRAIVRAKRFGNDTRLGPPLKILHATDDLALGYEYQSQKREARVEDGELLIQDRQVFPIDRWRLNDIRNGNFQRGLVDKPFFTIMFGNRDHRKAGKCYGVNLELAKLMICALGRTYLNKPGDDASSSNDPGITSNDDGCSSDDDADERLSDCSLFADPCPDQQHSFTRRRSCRNCERLVRCDNCLCEFGVEITEWVAEMPTAHGAMGRLRNLSEFCIIINRWANLGNGVVPIQSQFQDWDQRNNAWTWVEACKSLKMRYERAGGSD
ncbi:MAG: hypothetical protein M1831_001645 [Alyxoria varia]|nr:MAG: hypothetical protein M1831_001645 [Alyxoria varia]